MIYIIIYRFYYEIYLQNIFCIINNCDKLLLNKNIGLRVPFACEYNILHLRRPEGYSPIVQVFFVCMFD